MSLEEFIEAIRTNTCQLNTSGGPSLIELARPGISEAVDKNGADLEEFSTFMQHMRLKEQHSY